MIYSTVVPAGTVRLGRNARTGVCRTSGEAISLMRMMKSVMAICAVGAAMLTMASIRRMWMSGPKKKRRREKMMMSRYR